MTHDDDDYQALQEHMGDVELSIMCIVCGHEIAAGDGMLDRCVRIEKGDFDMENRANDHVIVSMYMCRHCYHHDPDLCRFFNKLGRRVR